MKSLLLIFIIAISSITNVQALQELSKSEKKKYAHIPMQVIDSSEAKKNVGLGVFFKECFHDDKIMVKKTSRSFDGGCLLINGTKENISKMKTKLNRAAIKHCESYNRKAYYRGNGEFKKTAGDHISKGLLTTLTLGTAFKKYKGVSLSYVCGLEEDPELVRIAEEKKRKAEKQRLENEKAANERREAQAREAQIKKILVLSGYIAIFMASSALLFALYRKLPAIRSRWQKHRENQRSILMQQQSSDGSTATVSSQGYLKRIGWVIGGLIIILLIANLGNNDSKIAERERIQLCKNMWSSFSGGVASCNSFIESEHMKLVKRYKQLNTNLDRDKYFCSPIKAKNTSNDRIVYCFNLVQENINNRIANNNNSKPTKRNGPSFGQILGLGLGILGGFDAMNNPESYQPYTLPKSKNTPSVNNQYGNKICYYDCLGTIYTLNIDPLGFCPLSASFDNKTCFQK